MKIVADNKIPFLKGVFEPYAGIEYLSPADIVNNKLAGVDALIIRTRTKCNSALLKGTGVKLIATATIGHDHIDSGYCTLNNIKWINAPGCNSTSVMQYISSALLIMAEKKNLSLQELTLGIVGVGNVGAKVEKAARLLGMNLLLNDPPRARVEGEANFVSLDEILSSADIISFHVPLIKEGIDKTYHMADSDFFAKLKKKIILINSSRGEVVDSQALKNALQTKKVAGSVIDVWEQEPVIDIELLKLADIATPHIAGYSSDGKANGTSVCVNAVSEYFNLGIEKNWYPYNIPEPFNSSKIKIDCRNLSDQEIFLKAVTHSYDVLEDNSELKLYPEYFEKQRDFYRVRREFKAYSVELINAAPNIAVALEKLGFKVINI